jgi:type I restriction enzyme R subunit
MDGLHFSQSNRLISETADLYEPPLDMFGADAVERWFTEKEVQEVVEFANRMAVSS